MLTCLFCKTLFSPKRINKKNPQKYCCYKCSVDSKQPKIRSCKTCGGDTSNPVFCSKSCSAIFNNTGSTQTDSTKHKISEFMRTRIFSDLQKEEIVKKRLATYRKNNGNAKCECICCKKIIPNKNKHKMCLSCYLDSDAAVKAWGHFSKSYNKGYVFSPYANKNIYLLSGLEIAYAQWLNDTGVKWDKPKSVGYQLGGKHKNIIRIFC